MECEALANIPMAIKTTMESPNITEAYPVTKPVMAMPRPPIRAPGCAMAFNAMCPQMTAGIPGNNKQVTNPMIPQIKLAIASPEVGAEAAAPPPYAGGA